MCHTVLYMVKEKSLKINLSITSEGTREGNWKGQGIVAMGWAKNPCRLTHLERNLKMMGYR